MTKIGGTPRMKKPVARLVGAASTVVAVVATVIVFGVPGGSTPPKTLLSSGTDFTITGSVVGLAPGVTGSLVLTVTNPKSVPITVQTLSASPSATSPAPATCPFSNLDLSQAVFNGPGFVVGPKNGTATRSLPISLKSTAGDGCQGVTFPLDYAGTATYTLDTTTALASSQSSSTAGQAVTFTATVTASETPPGAYTGNVAFMDGAATLSTVPVSSSGTAQLSTSSLAVGSHQIKAVFTPTDTNFTGSTSNTVTQQVAVGAKQTTLALTSSPNPSVYGNTVNFTAAVAASKGAKPTGMVKFYDGTTLMGTASVQSNGSAVLPDPLLSAGSHSVTAVYPGDSAFAGSTSNAVTQVVNKAARTVTLASSPNPSPSGQPVTMTATVALSTAPVASPTGTVTFFDGTTALGTAPLSAAGQATFNTTTLTLGSHSLKAVYNGDGNFSPSSSNTVSQSVLKASTTGLTSSSNPSTYGTPVTFTATVTGSGGTPTGSVTFSDGSTVLGSRALSGGQATLTTAALTAGSHSIKAVYSGDGAFAGSTSGAVSQSVGKASRTVTLASSPNPSKPKQQVSFTASLPTSSAPVANPTGLVTFFDGTTMLATVSLSSSAQATYKTTPATGSHSITAVYNGDGNFNGATSAVLTQTVK
jgi:hypothetical protein